jgi:hypothetical protein
MQLDKVKPVRRGSRAKLSGHAIRKLNSRAIGSTAMYESNPELRNIHDKLNLAYAAELFRTGRALRGFRRIHPSGVGCKGGQEL